MEESKLPEYIWDAAEILKFTQFQDTYQLENVWLCVCTKFTKARWPTTCALQRLVGFELCSDVPMCSYCLMF